MTPELANAALVFLSRTDIKGAEAPTFMQVATMLEAIARRAPVGVPEPTSACRGTTDGYSADNVA